MPTEQCIKPLANITECPWKGWKLVKFLKKFDCGYLYWLFSIYVGKQELNGYLLTTEPSLASVRLSYCKDN